jgi:hypothetical protein
MTLEVHIAELVVTDLPLVHAERLGPAVEAALARRLTAGEPTAAPPLTAVTPEAVADAIAATVHEAIHAAGATR